MLKLINQFDNPNMRPTVATPTCAGCCCCCCCCVISTLATGIITTRNVAQSIEHQRGNVFLNVDVSDYYQAVNEDDNEKQKNLIDKQAGDEFFYKFVGAVAFPSSLVATLFFAVIFRSIIGVVFGLAVYAVLMSYLVRRANLSSRKAIVIIILSIIAFVAEFFVGSYLFMEVIPFF